MPRIPRTPLADPARGVTPAVQVDVEAMTAPARTVVAGSHRLMEDSDRLMETALRLQEEKDALTVVDHLTQFRNLARDYVVETKKKVGKNALDLQPAARDWLSQTVDGLEQVLTSDRQRTLFRKLAAGEVDRTLNQIASHEFSQLTQYRNDLRQDSLNESLLAIRNAAGDKKLIQDAVDRHLLNLNVIYHGQDVTDYKTGDASRLNLEALTQLKHWQHTQVANELMTKFEGDHESMYRHLMDPNNYKELSIEEKHTIGNIITSEFSKLKAFKKEEQAATAADLWAEYYEVRFGSRRGEKGALAQWHAKVADMTRRGLVDGHVMQNAIALEAQEQASIRAATAAQRAQEEWERKNSPLLRDDPEVAARWTEMVIKDPASPELDKLSEYLGRGLSYKTFEHLSGLRKSKEKAIWATPNGKLVGNQLSEYRRLGKFSTDLQKNNEEFTIAVKRMEKFLLRHPDATAEQINQEMNNLMRPYLRSTVLKMFDKLEDWWKSPPKAGSQESPPNVLEDNP